MIAAAVAVPLAIGATVLAARSVLPSLVRQRVERAIEARLGLSAHVDSVVLGVSSIELIGVHVGDHEGVEPLGVDADRVTLQVGVWSALTDGVKAVSAVHVDALAVELRQDHHALDAWWKHVRPATRARTGVTPAEPAWLPDIHVDRVSVGAHDAQGPLVAATAEHLSLVRDALSVQIGEVTFGSVPGTVVTLKDVELNGDRVDGVFGLRDVHVGSAVVALAAPDAPSLIDRLERLVPPRADDTAEPAPTKDATAEPTTEPPATEEDPRIGALLRRMSEGSLIVIERANVTRAGQLIVRDLKARMQMTRAAELLLEGVGHTTADGMVEWKLRLWPRELRGEGNVDLERLPLSLLSAVLPALPWHDIDKSTVDAQLVLQGDGAARIGWSGRMTLANVALYSPRIAPEAVRIPSISLEGRGHLVSADRRLEIEEGRVTLGAATSALSGAVEWTADHYLIDLNANLPRSACEDVLHAIPRTLLGEIANFHLTGSIAGKLHIKADSRSLSNTELDMGVDDRCDFVEVPRLADLRRFTGPFVHVAVEPNDAVFEMETGPGTEHWTPIEDISPLFVHAVLAHEDTQFFSHHGFSPMHIRGALVRNLEAGRYVLGASTISMQLVKNLLLRREKTLARKAQEVVLTWWVERMLDKRDILELYLNVIEYGPSVYGIRHASQYYFSRDPHELSPAESVFLSTILPNPKAYHSFFEKNALSNGWTERMRSQIQRMQTRGWYATETGQYALNELKSFRFYPEGSVRTPSAIPMPTKTSLLPYQPGALLSNGFPTMDQLNFATIDGGD